MSLLKIEFYKYFNLFLIGLSLSQDLSHELDKLTQVELGHLSLLRTKLHNLF